MITLESIPTGELKCLRDTYTNAASATLTAIEQLAIVRAVETELADRAAALKSGFNCGSEVDALRVLLAEKDEEIFFLRMQVETLEEQLATGNKFPPPRENSPISGGISQRAATGTHNK